MKREDALHMVNEEVDELLSTILCCTGSNFNLHNASTTVQEMTKLLIYLSACLLTFHLLMSEGEEEAHPQLFPN